MKSSILTTAIACLFTNVLYSQPPKTAAPMSEDKKIATQVVLAGLQWLRVDDRGQRQINYSVRLFSSAAIYAKAGPSATLSSSVAPLAYRTMIEQLKPDCANGVRVPFVNQGFFWIAAIRMLTSVRPLYRL
ncbi:MAG TPA: hypothetical protein PLN21_16090 [Gemmatales bacterium]|nr:hypothetical protein [Gemmatales bacterium]